MQRSWDVNSKIQTPEPTLSIVRIDAMVMQQERVAIRFDVQVQEDPHNLTFSVNYEITGKGFSDLEVYKHRIYENLRVL